VFISYHIIENKMLKTKKTSFAVSLATGWISRGQQMPTSRRLGPGPGPGPVSREAPIFSVTDLINESSMQRFSLTRTFTLKPTGCGSCGN
jgi:hypothetical protein